MSRLGQELSLCVENLKHSSDHSRERSSPVGLLRTGFAADHRRATRNVDVTSGRAIGSGARPMASVNRLAKSSRSGSLSPNSDGPKAAMKKPAMSDANASASPVFRQRSIAAFG